MSIARPAGNEGSFLNLTLAQTTGVAPAKGQRQPLAGGRFEHDSDADEDDDPLAGEAISALGAGQPPPTPSKTFFSLPFEHSFSCPCREREMEILSRALTRLEANDAAVGASEPRDGGEEKKPEQMPDAPGLSVVAKHIKAAAVCIGTAPLCFEEFSFGSVDSRFVLTHSCFTASVAHVCLSHARTQWRPPPACC